MTALGTVTDASLERWQLRCAERLGNALGYRYPHDVADGVLAQQYPPDEIVGRDYYQPTERGAERAIAERLPRLRRIVRDTTTQ